MLWERRIEETSYTDGQRRSLITLRSEKCDRASHEVTWGRGKGAAWPEQTFQRRDELSVTECLWRVAGTRWLQGGELLPGPKSGLLSNTRKWIVQGDTCADKAIGFIGKGFWAESSRVRGTEEDCSAEWLEVLGFMVTGLVSRLSLPNHSDPGSSQVVCPSLNQDGSQ